MGLSEHDFMVEQYYKHPDRAGLEDVVISAREVMMRRPGNPNVLGVVDNVMFCKKGDLYLLEHKSALYPSPQCEAKALVQLTTARMHFYEYLGLLGTMLYSHGYRVEEVE